MVIKPRPQPPVTRVVRAAGAITWRFRTDIELPAHVARTRIPTDPEQIEVLLVHRPRYHDWSWPKGKIEAGESLITCATREVEEETGIPVRLGAPMTTQRYRLGAGHTKEVHYWVGTVDLAESALRARAGAKRAPAKEIDRIRWARVNKARKLLTRRGDRRLLDELVTRLEAGTLATRPVILLRHAKALARSVWGEDEPSRPLARTGAAQVPDLTGLLSAYGIDTVYSSPWRRCFATVAGYVAVSAASMHSEKLLTEAAVDADPAAASAFMTEILDHGRSPIAVCGHRPTFAALVAPVEERTSRHLTIQLPDSDPYLRTAQMLVLHVAAPQSWFDQILGKVDEKRPKGAVTPADIAAKARKNADNSELPQLPPVIRGEKCRIVDFEFHRAGRGDND